MQWGLVETQEDLEKVEEYYRWNPLPEYVTFVVCIFALGFRGGFCRSGPDWPEAVCGPY